MVSEARDGGAKVSLRRVPELLHEGMPVERLLHDAPLDSTAAAMNEAYLPEPALPRSLDVFVDQRRHIPREKSVEIERSLDWDLVIHAAAYVAVTTVLIPPRTEKSPTTVMRRGAQAATRSSRIWLVTAS